MRKIIQETLKQLPGVDKLLELDVIKLLLQKHSRELVTFCIRSALVEYRSILRLQGDEYSEHKLLELIQKKINSIEKSSLKGVINATGVLLHTNLGRAPLGEKILADIAPIVSGYSNLEVNLETGKRGNRNQHIKHLLNFLTKAEDSVVVNNNAAAVFLSLKTFGENGETIVSRGELIEIGGSFRLPDIMKNSGTKMVEVGATNKTRLSDYEEAINENTKILFKAHQSNFFMKGFTEEVELQELTNLAHRHNLIMIYDLGSGLLRKPKSLDLSSEPDIESAISAGVDIVTFSGDKLLGGPQAGIIAGKKTFVEEIAKAPLMRAFRVGKLTISALHSAMKHFLQEETLIKELPIFRFLSRDSATVKGLAKLLQKDLETIGVQGKIIPNIARTGGGTLPKVEIPSFAIELNFPRKEAVKLHHFFLNLENPVVTILREGKILLDVFALEEKDLKVIFSAFQKFVKSYIRVN
jgi:L-seryl-tRNA(Ser) seleniumtransferase